MGCESGWRLSPCCKKKQQRGVRNALNSSCTQSVPKKGDKERREVEGHREGRGERAEAAASFPQAGAGTGAVISAKSPPCASPAALHLVTSRKRIIYSFCFQVCFYRVSNLFLLCRVLDEHRLGDIFPPCLQMADLELKQTQPCPANNPCSPFLHLSHSSECFQPLFCLFGTSIHAGSQTSQRFGQGEEPSHALLSRRILEN